jgi:hypothetical protein
LMIVAAGGTATNHFLVRQGKVNQRSITWWKSAPHSLVAGVAVAAPTAPHELESHRHTDVGGVSQRAP